MKIDGRPTHEHRNRDHNYHMLNNHHTDVGTEMKGGKAAKMEKRYGVEAVMKLYGISRNTAMSNIFRRKGCGAFKIGKLWFIRESDLLNLEKQYVLQMTKI